MMKSSGRMQPRVVIPKDTDSVTVTLHGRKVRLTNLDKPFWNDPRITKGDLLQYYADVSSFLLPHLTDRPMVMKRYPNGAEGEHFFMKRAPAPRPEWVKICSIPHRRGNVIDFALVQDLAALLWIVNLGCIDLNPWYGRCDDYDRPDFLHFDLDPGPGTDFGHVRDTALRVRDMLDGLDMPSYVKTTGSRGLHVYVPILRGPLQKEVWTVAKEIAHTMERHAPTLVTAEYRIANRPYGRVLIDYNQNAWGRTLASVYSVRPQPLATVSMPVNWEDVETGMRISDYRLDNVPGLLRQFGDCWKPLVGNERFDLHALARSGA
jgi:bifunctional non-homologous end joining protein LigD